MRIVRLNKKKGYIERNFINPSVLNNPKMIFISIIFNQEQANIYNNFIYTYHYSIL